MYKGKCYESVLTAYHLIKKFKEHNYLFKFYSFNLKKQLFNMVCRRRRHHHHHRRNSLFEPQSFLEYSAMLVLN
jgi:hypothetical protein